MNRKDFKNEYEKRGWTPITLSNHWGCSKTRIHQIAVEVESKHKKSQLYVDALHGLAYLKEG